MQHMVEAFAPPTRGGQSIDGFNATSESVGGTEGISACVCSTEVTGGVTSKHPTERQEMSADEENCVDAMYLQRALHPLVH